MQVIVHQGVMHSVFTQTFPKNFYYLSPDTHTYIYTFGGKKEKFFGRFCVLTKRIIPKYLKYVNA